MLAKAFWSLVNLSLDDQNKRRIYDQNGMRLILESMVRFPDHEELQYRALFALINLSIPPHAKDLLRELGGLPLILHTIRQFPHNPSIVRCVSNIIISLSWSNEENRQRFLRLNAEGSLRSAAQTYHDDDGVFNICNIAMASLTEQ